MRSLKRRDALRPQRGPSPDRKRPRLHSRRRLPLAAPWVLLSSLLVTFLLAAAANLTLELWQHNGSLSALGEGGLARNLTLFFLGSLVLWLVIVLLLAATGRLWITVGLTVCVTVTIAFANHEKLQFRMEPLYPSDFAMVSQVNFLSHMAGPMTTLGVVVGLVSIMTAAVVIGRFANRVFPRVRRRTHPRLAVGLLVTRGAAAVLSVLALGYIWDFNAPGNQFRAAYEDQGAHWKEAFQPANYVQNGFVGGMLYNTDILGMTRPDGYSEDTMRALAAKYAERAAAINRDRDANALADVNVVLVLSETFTDPTRIRGVEFAEDPIPYTRSLMQQTTSGNMLASKFGGGTANMEFSALTGMSMALFQPQMSTPYQLLVPDYPEFPSLAWYLKSQGHRAAAIHPFLPSLYRRGDVYPVLGFDSIKFATDMTHQEGLDGQYISDQSAFAEATDELQRSQEPVFINLVTMQNHYPMAGKYDDPIPVTGLEGDPEAKANAEHYARGLKHSDQALQRFLESLEAFEEKTVVLFYGDHLPALWPEQVRRANGARRMRETPFFVYTNFGRLTPRDLPTTSPTHFASHILRAADAPVPPYYALLMEIEKEVPAMESLLMVDQDNRTIHDQDLSARARELLHDYRLVQFDLSVGKRYSQDDMLYPEPENLSTSY